MAASKKTLLLLLLLPAGHICFGQLTITPQSTAAALAQNLVGNGITISNVTYTGNPLMSGSFSANNPTVVGIREGIVLTNGRAKSQQFDIGTDNNGFSTGTDELADNGW